MKKRSLSRRTIDKPQAVEPSSADAAFQKFVEEAEICCEHARLAARLKRYKSARGLFLTAAALYQQALKVAGISYPSLENRLREIELEIAAPPKFSGAR
jgi:hypothetical protein